MDKWEKQQLLQRMEAGEFRKNNGLVLRSLNILGGLRYLKLSTLATMMKESHDFDVSRSIDYFDESGYIHVRLIDGKQPVHFCDHEPGEVEIKLTAKGTNLLRGSITDPDVE